MVALDPNFVGMIYVVAPTRAKALRFARERGLPYWTSVQRVEDLPRQQGIRVVLLPGYDKLPDYECLFGVGGLFYDFAAFIHYPEEVPHYH